MTQFGPDKVEYEEKLVKMAENRIRSWLEAQ